MGGKKAYKQISLLSLTIFLFSYFLNREDKKTSYFLLLIWSK